MSPVFVDDGRLVVDPEATSIELPTDITPELLDAVFKCSPGEPGHIAELHQRMTRDEKIRFEDACYAAGEQYAKSWAVAATNWAIVGTETGSWVLTDLKPIVKRDIHSWLIDHLYVDKFNFWYAECRDQRTDGKAIVLSNAEFEARYGDTFAEHLRKILEFMPIRLNQMIDAMETPWVSYRVTCMCGDSIVTETLLGPAQIPPKEWLMPADRKFVSAEPA